MLKVHARNLGNVAFLCMQGQIVNGETELCVKLSIPVGRWYGRARPAQVSAVDARPGRDVGVARAGQAKGISFKIMNVSNW